MITKVTVELTVERSEGPMAYDEATWTAKDVRDAIADLVGWGNLEEDFDITGVTLVDAE